MDKPTITKRNQRNMLADSILDHTSLDQSMRFGQKAGLAVEENGHKKVCNKSKNIRINRQSKSYFVLKIY